MNLHTTAAVTAVAVGDRPCDRIGILFPSPEAAVVVTLHVTIGDEVSPTYLLSIALSLHFHAGDCDISPVGTFDGVQTHITLVFLNLLQVNNQDTVVGVVAEVL